MPTVRNYNASSIVYFQEDKGEDIFVLQKGKILLISSILGSNEENRKQLKSGEFFGVGSALGDYPREQTAQAMENSSLVVFSPKEFEKYIIHNSRLMVKMLQVFSHELRDIHLNLRSILKVGQEKNPAFELLNIAESFHKAHNMDHALYAYQCYLKNYPNGKNKTRAQELLEMCQQDKTYPSSYDKPESESEDFVPKKNNLDEKASSANSNLLSLYDKAKKFLETKQWKEAIATLQKCTDENSPRGLQEKESYEKAHYELGLALLKNKETKEAGNSFSNYIKSFPSGEYVRHSVYQLALIQETQANFNQALTLYHKVATMRPHDAITMKARAKLQEVAKKRC